MAASFDHIASTYDNLFTHSRIGSYQRKAVWRYLERIIPQLHGLEILELNCGTGEDAAIFSNKGFNVLATDISSEMLSLTIEKTKRSPQPNNVLVRAVDLEHINETIFNKKFDLVFSNFGGLNCLSPASLKKLFMHMPVLLNPGGRFVAVIMPKYCLWEVFYFLYKREPAKAFRRWTNHSVQAKVKGATVTTWYYSPRAVRKWLSPIGNWVDTRPIGIALPPSYLEKYFASNGKALNKLNTLENKLKTFSFFSPFADHFIIDIKFP